MVKIDHLQHQRKGILYYFLSTLMLALMLFSYIFGTTIINVMDVTGWTFFTLSCLSHAAILLLRLAGTIAPPSPRHHLVCCPRFAAHGGADAQPTGLSALSVPHQRHHPQHVFW